jgi:MFS family permease
MLGTLIGGLLVAPLGWRRVFLVVGLPGIALALLLRLTVREPARPQAALAAAAAGPSPWQSFVALLRSIGALLRIPTFAWIALGGAFAAIAGTGFGAWLPEMFVRSHGMALRDFGMSYGLVSGAAGVGGTLAAGLLADRLARFDPRWRLRVAAASVALSMPLLIAICAVPNPRVAIWLSVPSGIVGAGYAPVLFAIAQSLAPVRRRAVASSVLILFITGGGMFLGPSLIGALSDLLTPRFGADALRVAMIALLATMSFGVLALLRGARSLMTDLEKAASRA